MPLLNTEYNCQLLCHVQGFPLLRLLRADLTSKGSSFVSLLTRLLYHRPDGTPLDLSSSWSISLCMPRLDNSADSPQPHPPFTWITAALHGLRWRYKPRQSVLIFIGAIPALQDHDNPYGLHNSLCTLHQYCSRDAVLTAEKHLLISHSAKGATLDTGGWLNLTWQGLTPCKMHQASLDALTPC